MNTSTNAINLNKIKTFVKANVMLQCKQLHAPRLAIQGAPGTGKSDIIREICEENGWMLSVKYLSNMSLEQITGIPCKVENGSTAVWSKPELFNFDCPEYMPAEGVSEDTVKILLIDDFHLADKIMQKYLFQLLTYKSLNGYHLPKNTAILLAGNRLNDKALATSIPAPVCNRLMFMEVKSDVNDWLVNFAFKHGVREDITSYIHQYGLTSLQSEPVESTAWASPRSWTYLSYQMDAFESMNGSIDIHALKQIASGLIGTENANKFIEYRELFAKWNFNSMFNSVKNDINITGETNDSVYNKIFNKFESAITKNPTDVYTIISAGVSWLLVTYRDNSYDINNNTVKLAVKFLHDIFIYLMVFKDATIRRNTRPLILAGIKYLHIYQNAIISHGICGNSSILDAFIQTLANKTNCDWLFYEMLCTIFEYKLDADELAEIKKAKEALKI
jgi:hypothetical protein